MRGMVLDTAKRALRPAKKAIRIRRFPGSGQYWERRYAEGRGSGVGSEGPLAEFKAEVLNKFVADNDVASVIEFGCGDGQQLARAKYPRYLGLDVSPTIIDKCLADFAGDDSKSFALHDTLHFSDPAGFLRADLAMSLDVIFHLVEDDIFDAYMRHLFAAAERFVVVYSSNVDVPREEIHYRQRAFTPWIEQHQPGWRLREKVENPHRGREGAVADFYFYERV